MTFYVHLGPNKEQILGLYKKLLGGKTRISTCFKGGSGVCRQN